MDTTTKTCRLTAWNFLLLGTFLIFGVLPLQAYTEECTPTGSRAAVAVAGDALNRCPVADAGISMPLMLGQATQLDGSASTDRDGQRLRFEWTLVEAPFGSAAAAADANAVRTQFVADLAGDYEFSLTVTDAGGAESFDTVRYSSFNTSPVANAGPDVTAGVGELVTLDAIRSYDADGQALDHRWQLVGRPASSASDLLNRDQTQASLFLDAPGDYVVDLIVDDGRAESVADVLLISTSNSAPIADAGRARSFAPDSTVVLNGKRSADMDGDALSNHWAVLSAPAGSAVSIDDPSEISPSAFVDAEGQYLFQLTVDDGKLASQPHTVLMDVQAQRLQHVDINDFLPLNRLGGGSDMDGDGVPDLVDNCVVVANAPQRDTDGDGLGNFCDADLNNDGIVNTIDLGLLKQVFFTNDPDADFDGNGIVNAIDLGRMKLSFFKRPGPAGTTIWISLVDGDWNNRLNWWPAVVPAAGTTAIANVGTDVTITLSGNGGEVTNLTLDEDLIISNTSFTASGAVEASGAITATSSTISNTSFGPSLAGSGNITLNSSAHTWAANTLGLDTLLNNGTIVNVTDGITVDSTLTIDAPTSPTGLQFVNSQTLDGSGTIVLDGLGNSQVSEPRIFPFNATTLTIAPTLTIRGGKGTIGNSFAALVLNADVTADVSGETLLIAGNTWSGTTSLTAINGGNIDLSGNFNNLSQPINIDTAGGSINLLNGAALRNATINGQAGTKITINSGVTVFENTVINADFNFVNGALTNVIGGLTVNGNVLIDAPTSPTGMQFTDSQTLTGVATITFDGVGNSQIAEPRLLPFNDTTLTIDPGIVIRGGKGTIGNAFASLVLNGDVFADVSGETLLIAGTTWNSTATLTASNSGILHLSGNFNNGGNALGLDTAGGSINLLNGAQLRNATINGTAGTDLTINSGVTTFESLIYTGDMNYVNGALTNVSSGLTINGTVTVDAPSSPTGLQFSNTQRLDGTATFKFNATGNNVVTEPRILPFNATTLTIGADVTIRGGTATVGQHSANLVFLGDLVSEKAGEEIAIGGAGWSANGNMQAINDGEIRFFGALDNGGNALAVDAADGAWSLTNSTALNDATLNGTAGTTLNVPAGTTTFTTMTFNHDLSHANAALTNVTNGLTINGISTIVAPASPTGYMFTNSQSLSGTADIVFDSTGNSVVSEPRLFPVNATTLTIGPAVTIRGATGTVGNASASTVLNGAIVADVLNDDIVLTGNTITGSGLISALNGGVITLSGVVDNANQTLSFDTAGGSLIVNASSQFRNVTLAGAAGTNFVMNAGTHTWQNLIVTADITMNNGALANVTDGLIVNGTLNIDAPTSPTGLHFNNTMTLGGAATIVFDGTGNGVLTEPRLLPANSTTTTIASTVTVRGGVGTIGQAFGGIINEGTISADTGRLQVRSLMNVGRMETINANQMNIFGYTANTGSTLHVGAGSQVEIDNFVTFDSIADTVEIDIESLSSRGRIILHDNASFSGTLTVNAVNGYSPIVGDNWVLIDHLLGGVVGTFVTVNSVGLGAGESFAPTYNSNNLTVTVVD